MKVIKHCLCILALSLALFPKVYCFVILKGGMWCLMDLYCDPAGSL